MLSDCTAGERTHEHVSSQSSRAQRVVENSAIDILELLREGGRSTKPCLMLDTKDTTPTDTILYATPTETLSRNLP